MRRQKNDHRASRAWRAYCERDGRQIQYQLQTSPAPCCPCCGDLLEARPGTRFNAQLPTAARGYDLDCRACRRFWCVIRHTSRSIRLLRMKRFAAAVLAARPQVNQSPMPPQAAV